MTTHIRPRGVNLNARETKRCYFTDRKIIALPPPDRTLAEYDAERPTLGLRRLGTGLKIFFWSRNVNGRGEWRKLGEYPATSVEVARAKAEELDEQLADYARKGFSGPNPFAEEDVPAVLTLENLVEVFIRDHVALHWTNKEKGARSLRAFLERHYWIERLQRVLRRPSEPAFVSQNFGPLSFTAKGAFNPKVSAVPVDYFQYTERQGFN